MIDSTLIDKTMLLFFERGMVPTIPLLAVLVGLAGAQDRRPTISFITQPEIVTDIGGNVSIRKGAITKLTFSALGGGDVDLCPLRKCMSFS